MQNSISIKPRNHPYTFLRDMKLALIRYLLSLILLLYGPIREHREFSSKQLLKDI